MIPVEVAEKSRFYGWLYRN